VIFFINTVIHSITAGLVLRKMKCYNLCRTLRKNKEKEVRTDVGNREKVSIENRIIAGCEFPARQAGCVIMASGLGRRFGGNKLMAKFEGVPLICQVLNATEGIFGRRIVVTRHEAIRDLCRLQGVEVIFHELPGRNDTVRLGLSAIEEGLSACVFCPGDQPLLKKETLRKLVLAGMAEPDKIFRVGWGRQEGSPVLFPAKYFPELKALPDGKGGGEIIRRNSDQMRIVQAGSAAELKDIDYPEDLKLLQRDS